MSKIYFVNLTCTEINEYCPIEYTVYAYYPSLGFNGFFTAAFAILALYHIYNAYRYGTYMHTGFLICGCIGEAIGYLGRILLHTNPYSTVYFDMQYACLIFSPSFISGGLYFAFQNIAVFFGHSPVPPWVYAQLFIIFDSVCLITQAVGGGLAGSAAEFAFEERLIGTDLMIAGVAAQLFIMTVLAVLVAHYAHRLRKNWNRVSEDAAQRMRSTRFRLFLAAMLVAWLGVYTRSCYRVPELSGGWGSPLMRDQPAFIVLEGFLVLIAAAVLAVFHPGDEYPKVPLAFLWKPLREKPDQQNNLQVNENDNTTAQGQQGTKEIGQEEEKMTS